MRCSSSFRSWRRKACAAPRIAAFRDDLTAFASEKGVRIKQGVEVKRILVLGNKILGVETSEGRIKTDTVVCTAGVWSREVAALVGVDLPVVGEPRWVHYTPEAGPLPEKLPLTIDFSSGFYFHREGKGLVFGGREPTI